MPATAPTPKRIATRAKLLRAAGQVLADDEGRLEMSALARVAGVSHGTAFHHFGSKDGVLCAVVEDFYDRLEGEVLLDRLDDHTDWEARERDRVRRYIAFLVTDPLGRVVQSLAQVPAVAAVEAARWERLVAVGATNIAQGQRRGVVTAEQDSALLAALVLGAARSAVGQALAQPTKPDVEALTEHIWTFLGRGLVVRSVQPATVEDH